MKTWKILASFILWLVLGLDTGNVFAVTLTECKELSLKNSSLIASYENLVQSSIYSYRRDKSSLYGQLTAFYQPDNIQFSDRSDLGRTHGYETRVGASFAWDLQKILTDYPALSRLEVGKSKLLKSTARHELIKTVTQNYYRLYVLLKKKKEYQDVLDLFGAHINDIRQLQSRGLDVAFDLNRAQVQFHTLKVSFKNIDSEIRDVLLSLNSMMDASYKEKDFAVMDSPDMSVPDFLPLDYSNVQEVKLDKIDVDSAKAMFEQGKFYYLPTIQFGLEHNVNTVDPNVEEYRSFLSLNFDIFDFGTKANEEKRLKYNYDYQKELFQDNRKKLTLKLQQMVNDMDNLRQEYQTTMDNLKNAQTGISIAKDYYRQGKIKEIDLLSTFSDYLTAVDQFYDAQFNFLSQRTELEVYLKEPGE